MDSGKPELGNLHFHTFIRRTEEMVGREVGGQMWCQKVWREIPHHTTDISFHVSQVQHNSTILLCLVEIVIKVTSHLILMFKCRRSMGGLQKVSKVCSCS